MKAVISDHINRLLGVSFHLFFSACLPICLFCKYHFDCISASPYCLFLSSSIRAVSAPAVEGAGGCKAVTGSSGSRREWWKRRRAGLIWHTSLPKLHQAVGGKWAFTVYLRGRRYVFIGTFACVVCFQRKH